MPKDPPPMHTAHFEPAARLQLRDTEQQSTVDRIMAIALNPDVSVEKMVALIDLRDRLVATEARKAFDLAVSQAKSKIPPIVKDGRAGFDSKSGSSRTEYQYETLSAIARIVDPILAEFGLSYRFRINQDAAGMAVTCILSHQDGHSEPTTLIGPAADQTGSKNPYQAIGSGVTFLERYTLKAALGLSSERDDDGQAIGKDPAIDVEQFRQLNDLMTETKSDEKFLRIYGIEDLHELPARLFEPARALLMQRKAKASG
jgi:hypothetical protein